MTDARDVLMFALRTRRVVAGLAIAGIGSRAQPRDRDARSLRARAIRRWRRCLLFAVVGVAVLACFSTAASAAPTKIDSSRYLYGAACPSTSQCTAVDLDGQQVTFDPTSPGTPTPTTIDSTNPLNGEACPSTSQCTAVDDDGDEVTFNPTSPGTPTPMPIDSGAESGSGNGDLKGVACPSTSQCTAVDGGVTEVTFNPNSPGTTTPTTIDNGAGSLTGVACPSTSQCTAVDNAGQQMTFDPTSPFPSTSMLIVAYSLFSVACPSTSQCTAVDDFGQQVTFNPTSPGTPTPTTIDGTNYPDKYLLGVACPSTSQCTAVDNSGQQVTFDPTSPGTPTPTTIDSGNDLYSVACPSTSQCTAVDHSGNEVTFDPLGATKAKQECASRQLAISLGTLSAAGGHLALPIRFHDRGGTCSLRGFPRVDGLSANGRVIIRAKRTLKGYFGLWRIATITLKNGQTASALLEGLDPAFFSRPPRSSRRLRITPPNASHSVRRRTSYPLCHLIIHPVVAGRNGGGT